MRTTPENITSLESDQIFVFGSNLAGIHGKGAAKLAFDKFGASFRDGFGLRMQSYAIPTKGFNLDILSIDTIRLFIRLFIHTAKYKPHLTFFVTKVGCGLAGYKPEDIAPLFKDAMKLENVYLPIEFWDVLINKTKQ